MFLSSDRPVSLWFVKLFNKWLKDILQYWLAGDGWGHVHAHSVMWRHMVIKFATSGATWWPYLQPMQVTANGGKICRFLSKRLLQSKTQLPRSACNVPLLGTPLSKNKKKRWFFAHKQHEFLFETSPPYKALEIDTGRHQSLSENAAGRRIWKFGIRYFGFSFLFFFLIQAALFLLLSLLPA